MKKLRAKLRMLTIVLISVVVAYLEFSYMVELMYKEVQG